MSLNFGLIGCGHMGQLYAKKLKATDGIDLVAVADPDLEAARKAGGPLVAHFDNGQSLLFRQRLDAVVIASPTDTHFAHVGTALKMGVPILVEKPMTMTVREARHLVRDQAFHGGTRLAVGHIERSNPAIIHFRSLLQPDEEIFSVHAVRHGPRPKRARPEGLILDVMLHDIDLAMYLTGEYFPADIESHLSKHGLSAAGHIVFHSGAYATMSANWTSKKPVRRLLVNTNRKHYEIDLINKTVNAEGVWSIVPGDSLENQIRFFMEYIEDGVPNVLAGAKEGMVTVEVARYMELTADARRGSKPPLQCDDLSGGTGTA